ncbi:peptidase inhibitor family I36 protein [Streptomyces carpaticus]|nr:peptidase inhibitor family I36 protein [Streptomyces harbinensis]QKV68017.1 peptidase inhibitor family I36 protein [Streptomyces harbinensis]UWM48328.1 peptidase inhibitor family I36 protein [Streptomyces carpaticus]
MKKQMRKRFVAITAAAAALSGSVILANPTSAQPLAPAVTESANDVSAQATGGFYAYAQTDFKGPNKRFTGAVGTCVYVGDGWNDSIRSARTSSAARVELWDNYNCSGGAIVIDRTGYKKIGKWVSSYRVITSG